ncbi:adenine phosphoribosyltransferase [Nannocystaceae bacterium ST9]
MIDRDPAALELLRRHVRAVPDFPSPGILFRDITPLLADPLAFATAIEQHVARVADLAGELDIVVGMESRGFLFGSVLAHRLDLGFAPARKPGKLPATTIEESYALEYGSNVLQMHVDAIGPGMRVLIVDDLLATGGTALATAKLIERLGGEVKGCLFLIELDGLAGREKLAAYRVDSVLRY